MLGPPEAHGPPKIHEPSGHYSPCPPFVGPDNNIHKKKTKQKSKVLAYSWKHKITNLSNAFSIQFLSDDATEYSGFAISWYALNVTELTPHFNCSFDGPTALCPGKYSIACKQNAAVRLGIKTKALG